MTSTAPRADQHRRTARLLEPRHAADMIEMLMAAQEALHIGYLEAKAGDIGGDDFRTLGRAGIDQHQSVIALDQDRTDAAGANVPGVAVDQKGLRGLIPLVPVFAGLGSFALPCQLVAPVQGSPVQGSPMQRNRQVPWRDRE